MDPHLGKMFLSSRKLSKYFRVGIHRMSVGYLKNNKSAERDCPTNCQASTLH